MAKSWLEKHQSGSIAILVILMLVVLIGFLGLAIDVWLIVSNKQRIQDGVDLAALAGAQELFNNPGRAANVARNYGELNKIDRGNITVTMNYKQSSNKLQVKASKDIQFFFMPLFGISSTKVEASAAAEAVTVYRKIFDYVLFSGAENRKFIMSGSNNIIDGKVHINGDSILSGSNNYFMDDYENAGAFDTHEDNYFYRKLDTNADIEPMTYIAVEELKAKANIVYEGNVDLSNEKQIEGIIFVDGNVRLQDSDIKGSGTIVATGDIEISGSDLNFKSGDNLLAFYSLGNIEISGSNSRVEGVFYAPNGRIKIGGSNNVFIGALVADYFDSISGSNNQFIYDMKAQEVFGGNKFIRLIK